MAIEMLYFAWVREAVGLGSERIEPPAAVGTVSALLDWLGSSSEPHRHAFADRARLRTAVDQRFVALDAPIAGAREVAIFPPVTGG